MNKKDKLSFQNYIKEMATAQFGKYKEKHINDIDRGYATWMLKQIEEKGTSKGFTFSADDGTGNLSPKQIEDAIRLRARGISVAPTSVNKDIQPLSAPAAAPAPASASSPPVKQDDIKDPSKYQIPADKISKYQKDIEGAFANSKQHLVINALAGTGKAQPLTSKLLTPDGWKLMKDITLKDKVFGSDGLPHSIIGIFPQGEKEVYAVTFSDGSVVECCGEHLWCTESKKERDRCRAENKPLFSYSMVLNTSSILEDLKYKGFPKHYIPLVSPISFTKKDIPLDPYLLGVLLGDGSFRTGSLTYSTGDAEMVEYVNSMVAPFGLCSRRKSLSMNYSISGGTKTKGKKNVIKESIENLGLWNLNSLEKFIPDNYKYNSIENRIAVLQGLLDTDGSVGTRDSYYIEYSTASEKLCKDVKFIVESLGGIVKIRTRIPSYTYKNEKKRGNISYRMHIKLPSFVCPFRLKRKANIYSPATKYYPKRSIISIEPLGKKECQCISIDSSDHLYVTDNCVLTHNSTVLKHLAAKFSGGKKWLYIVFGKKNAEEATRGDKAFPPSVDTMTSHQFLGRVLANTKRVKPDLLPATSSQQRETDKYAGTKLDKIMDHDWFFNVVRTIARDLDSYAKDKLMPFNRKKNKYNVAFAIKKKISKIVGLAKNTAIDPRKLDAKEKLKDLLSKYDISGELYDGSNDPNMPNLTDKFVDMAMQVLLATTPKGKIDDQAIDTRQDFDDLLWWPTLHPDEVIWPSNQQYEVALIDEVQDFNNAQKVMLENLAKNGIRIVVVGDPAQSIYFFRGSDAKGFSNIEDMLKKTTAGASTHALPVNYRSGKKIIDYVNQNTHVKDLKAGRDHEGEVNPDMEEEELINQVQDEMAKDGKLKQETAFISRNNAPLFAISLGLLRNNIPFQIIGDDFSDEILDFIYNVVGNDKAFIGKSEAKYVSIDNFSKMLERYIEAKNDKFENQKDKEKYLQDLNRKNEALVGLIDHLKSQQMAQPKFENINKQKQIETVQDLCDHIQDLFKGLNPDNERDAQAIKNIDKTQTVMLTTAHKSKGLEFERVNIVGDELFPQTSDYSENLGEEEQQKHNLKYVAYTRATHTLNISNTPK